MAQPKWTYKEADAMLRELARNGGYKTSPDLWAEVVTCLQSHAGSDEVRRADAEAARHNKKIENHLRRMYDEAAIEIAARGELAMMRAIDDPHTDPFIVRAFMRAGLGGRSVLERVLSTCDDSLCRLAMGHPAITASDIETLALDTRRGAFLREQAAALLADIHGNNYVA
jgi:hypothetical protein